jgi:ribonuclease HII
MIQIGIDEVGRGPIAGPVAVGAFTCNPTFFDSIEIDVPLRDSKKLTQKQRQKWFDYLKDQKEKGNCDFSVSMVSAEWIDKVGIVRAIKKALEQSLNKLSCDPTECHVYLDGGLKAPENYTNQETVIKGDELHPVISCASIVAKVSRDNLMTTYSQEYPQYGFEKHVGYGTKMHYEAIKKQGVTVIHRKSFLKGIKV